MNLLFVIDNLGSGGAQRQMVNLACALTACGHHVEFFVYYPENHFLPFLNDAGIFVNLQHKTSRFSVAPILALRRFIRQRNFDILLSFLDTPNFYAEIACLGLRRTKLIVSERSMYPVGHLSPRLFFLQECHRLADFVVVNSHHQRERMERKFPWMKLRIQTIYNGYDLNVFAASEPIKKNDSRLRLLAISSVSYNKNSLNLAKALVVCCEKLQLDVQVDWVGTHQISGEGTRPAQETSDYLERMGLAERWNWLGVRTDIPQMLTNYDALIHPSFFEGLPNVVCEALACGCPVLVSHVCDHSRLVQQGVTGYLFDPDSEEQIAESIHTFSRLGYTERVAMSRAAREFAANHLSLNRFVKEYEQLFMELSGK